MRENIKYRVFAYIAICLFCGQILLHAESPPTELINDDFKDGLAGWNYNKIVSTGKYKLFCEDGKMIIECPEFAKAQVMYHVTSKSNVVPGANYILRYKIRAVDIERKPKKADSGGNIYVWLWDSSEKGKQRPFYFNECMMLEGNTTVNGEIIFTLPVDYKRRTITVWVRIYNAKGRLEIMKVSLTKI